MLNVAAPSGGPQPGGCSGQMTCAAVLYWGCGGHCPPAWQRADQCHTLPAAGVFAGGRTLQTPEATGKVTPSWMQGKPG